MRKSTWVLFTIVCFILIVCAPDESSGFVRRALKKVEKTVRKVVFKPVKNVFKEVVEKPVKSVLRAVGLKKVRTANSVALQESAVSRVLGPAPTPSLSYSSPHQPEKKTPDFRLVTPNSRDLKF